MRKIVMAGLVAAAAVLGFAGPAFAGTGTDGPTAVAREVAAARLERLLPQRPLASQSSDLFITGLSCASPTACLTIASVSNSLNPGKLVPEVERLHAGTWKPVTVKTPKGALMTMLQAVSCKAATYCLVVGQALSASVAPVALSWNGTVLSPVAAPPVPKADELESVTGVSCVAVRSCVVIGSGYASDTGDNVLFVWTLNGTKWGLKAISEPETTQGIGTSSGSDFSGVRCFSLTSCVVIGEFYTSTNSGTGETFTSTPLADSWNGKAFTPLNAPLPSGLSAWGFAGLSCVSAHACVVVGNASDKSGTDEIGFAEVWNGKTWTVTKWRGPKGDDLANLTGVSCASAVRCIAVGAHGNAQSIAPAALAWDGAKWTVLKVAGPGKGKADIFADVSCPVNGRCVATGEGGKSTTAATTPIAGYWNGRAWKYGPMFSAAAG